MAAVTLPTAMGAPRPESATCAGGSGDHGYTYTVTSQKGVPGDSIVGEYSVSGASGSEYPVSSRIYYKFNSSPFANIEFVPILINLLHQTAN